jgi:hypothetical protein
MDRSTGLNGIPVQTGSLRYPTENTCATQLGQFIRHNGFRQGFLVLSGLHGKIRLHYNFIINLKGNIHMTRIESLLTARLFLVPQLVGEQIYFSSAI